MNKSHAIDLLKDGVSGLLVLWFVIWGCSDAFSAPPAGLPPEAQAFDSLKVSEIEAWSEKSRLFLVLPNASDKKDVKIPRLANVIREIYWLSETDKKLQLQPEPQQWVIQTGVVPDAQPPALVLILDGPPKLFDNSVIARPGADHQVLLPAKFAITHGETLRFEPQPHKNTVGYWSNEKDTAEWHYESNLAGTYDVDILQGCGNGHGGSEVQIQIEDQTLKFEVQETGHFQNFIWRTIGTVQLKKTDEGVLHLIPVHKKAGAVMDVRAIRLAPSGTTRSFESELAEPTALPQPKQ